MFRFQGSESLKLTKSLAKSFASMEETPGERKRSKDRLDWIKSKYEDGILYNLHWATGTLNGKKYRVNGGHTSTFFADHLDGPFPTNLKAEIMHFDCDTLQDLAELFDQFDSPRSSRKLRESYTSHIKTTPGLEGISTWLVQKVIVGIATATELVDGGRIDRETRVRMVHSEQDAINFFAANSEFGLAIRNKSIFAAPVIGACYSMWEAHKHDNIADVEAFWILVSTENHPENDHPTRVLAKFLRTNLINCAHHLSRKMIYAKCIHAWNAYKRKQTTQLRYLPDANVPKPL